MKTIMLVILITIISNTACVPVARQASPDDHIQYRQMIDKGTAHLLFKQLDEAQAAFEVALQLAPEAESLDGLGCVAIERGQYAQAKQFFLRALEVNPEYTTALANLAALYHRVGDLDNAQRLYRATLDQEPSNYRARNNLGVVLAEMNSRNLAQKEIQRSQALYPTVISQSNLEVLSDKDS